MSDYLIEPSILAADFARRGEEIDDVIAAGADTFVLGSGIFGLAQQSDANRYDSIIKKLRAELAKVSPV